ncbi:MAG: glycine zipper 2TM domain-containing protein [Stagnimonas sp.]|nr:glycine zipper 2TM domain-containing protein [Stagnimonas sp.]
MKNAAVGIALGVGISAAVLASGYLMTREQSPEADGGSAQVAGADCWDETVTTTSSTRDNQVAGIVIGGALGGLAGNQVGEGDGKAAATAAGAVAGALIGKNAGKPKVSEESHVVRRCR